MRDILRKCFGYRGLRLIELTINDKGIGFDLEEILSLDRFKRGLGLNSMRERAELSSGSFPIESDKGVGTNIKVIWPTGK
ncbi:MAG: hypothetical protein A2169_07565 [Deltaproteobacteria bacterium RBG_13_47_9]|nr:MAG: hypothetical protein A2169_07565 [Deltaproteobacteria bacterium RBG_13_47_9]